MPVRFEVNGKQVEVEVEPRLTLADCLRHVLRLTGTHVGCEHGVCGACTVIVDGAAVRSCLMLAVQAEGSQIVTVEQANLANDACAAYGSPTTVGGTSYGVSNGYCYLFTLTATDNVGNVSTVQTTVKVDTTAPGAPTIGTATAGNGQATVTNNALVVGGGDFTVHNVTDPTNIVAPTLAITKSHVGVFSVGGTGTYSISVSNSWASVVHFS